MGNFQCARLHGLIACLERERPVDPLEQRFVRDLRRGLRVALADQDGQEAASVLTRLVSSYWPPRGEVPPPLWVDWVLQAGGLPGWRALGGLEVHTLNPAGPSVAA